MSQFPGRNRRRRCCSSSPYCRLRNMVILLPRLVLRPPLPLILPFFVLILSPMAYSASQSEALLLLKRSLDDTSGALDSWSPGSEPCSKSAPWLGLICYNGIVTGLHLGGMGLSGKINVDALLEIRGLRTVSLMNNSFSGQIPELNRLGALKAIFLSGNQFSGEISPDYFSKMGSLKKIWFSDNKFIGKIPTSVAQVEHLLELHLENNQFTGAIPDISLPTLMSLNVSNNKLEGTIPPSLSKFGTSAFAGNAGLCGDSMGIPCSAAPLQPQPTNDTDGSTLDEGKSNSGKIIGAVIGIVAVLVVIVALIICRMRGKQKVQQDFDVLAKERAEEPAVEKDVSVGSSIKKGMESTSRKNSASSHKVSSHSRGSAGIDLVLLTHEKGVFGLQDLMKAAAEVLGNGALGSSYKAVMTSGLAVAVKRIRDMNGKGRDEFDSEMRNLARFQHPNILTPLAYHYRKDEKLLISEYVPKGSLLYQLHGDRGPTHTDLNWPARLKIVKGIARGLGYLHTEFTTADLPHGNLKSSNILLGQDHEPLLADFAISQLINASHVTQALFAYKSPEAVQSNVACRKCDVYCLGIVILEILTGKFPSQYLTNGKGGTNVVQWVRSAISEGRESELIDPSIATASSSLGEIVTLLRIGAACTEDDPAIRPDMREAICRIEEIRQEPDGGESAGELSRTRSQSHLSILQEGQGSHSRKRTVSSSLSNLSIGREDSHTFSLS